mgnify:FL=1
MNVEPLISDEKVKSILEKLNKGLLFSPEWSSQITYGVYPQDAEVIDDPRAQIFRINNFLSEEECSKIISLYKERTMPSRISSDLEDYRVSKCCSIPTVQEEESIETSLNLDIKISNCLNIHPTHGEGTEFEYFQAGDFFKLHTDFFDSNTWAEDSIAAFEGQRTWTFVVYLNEVENGGETVFPQMDNLSIQPRAGMALAWNNLTKEGETNSFVIHEEKPVLKGFKAILTKCFRDKRLT